MDFKTVEDELYLLLSYIDSIDNIRDALKWTRTLTTVLVKIKEIEDEELEETIFCSLQNVTKQLLMFLHEDEEIEKIYGNSVFEVLIKILNAIKKYEKENKNSKDGFKLTETQNAALSVVKSLIIAKEA